MAKCSCGRYLALHILKQAQYLNRNPEIPELITNFRIVCPRCKKVYRVKVDEELKYITYIKEERGKL